MCWTGELCVIPVTLKNLPASGFDVEDMGNNNYHLKACN